MPVPISHASLYREHLHFRNAEPEITAMRASSEHVIFQFSTAKVPIPAKVAMPRKAAIGPRAETEIPTERDQFFAASQGHHPLAVYRKTRYPNRRRNQDKNKCTRTRNK